LTPIQKAAIAPHIADVVSPWQRTQSGRDASIAWEIREIARLASWTSGEKMKAVIDRHPEKAEDRVEHRLVLAGGTEDGRLE
jgi:hypothetical protein